MTPDPFRVLTGTECVERRLGLAAFLADLGFGAIPEPVLGREVPVPEDRRVFIREIHAVRVLMRRGRVLRHRVSRYRARSGLRGGRPSRRRTCSRAGPSEPHEPEPVLELRGRA